MKNFAQIIKISSETVNISNCHAPMSRTSFHEILCGNKYFPRI